MGRGEGGEGEDDEERGGRGGRCLTFPGTPALRKTDRARVGSTCFTSSPSSSLHSSWGGDRHTEERRGGSREKE